MIWISIVSDSTFQSIARVKPDSFWPEPDVEYLPVKLEEFESSCNPKIERQRLATPNVLTVHLPGTTDSFAMLIKVFDS